MYFPTETTWTVTPASETASESSAGHSHQRLQGTAPGGERVATIPEGILLPPLPHYYRSRRRSRRRRRLARLSQGGHTRLSSFAVLLARASRPIAVVAEVTGCDQWAQSTGKD